MTREEAFARVSTLLRKRGEGLDSAHRYAGASIAALEALGLIAFEDEAQDDVNMSAVCLLSHCMVEIHLSGGLKAGRLSMYGAGCILDWLRLNDLKVVRA